ncbi:MAG: EamA family transporter [Candidatus Omnitrophica bacterium]|nr:EamA family transporter [Candidatus Omnitrophota bacterium]
MWLLLTGAFTISFAPILVKAISLEPAWSAAWRLMIGTFFLMLLILGRAFLRRESLKKVFSEVKPVLILLTSAGFFFGIDLFFWHRSIHHVGAGMATVLGNTQVLYLTAWSCYEHRHKPSLRFLTAIFLAMSGLVLLVDLHHHSGQAEYLRGVVYGLLTGATYAGFLLFLRKAGMRMPHLTPLLKLFVISFAAAVFLVSASFATEAKPVFQAHDWLWLLLLGTVVHIGGWYLISQGLPKMPASKAGLILLTQPVLASALGWIFFREHLTPLQLAGMFMTLTGIYLGEAPGTKDE